MAIDELLTDNDFWSAFSTNPDIRNMFKLYEIKYKAHESQKGQPGYNPNNTEWYLEAKNDPKIIDAVRKFVEKQKIAQKAKTETIKAEKSAASGFFSERMQYAAGLATVLLAVALASVGMPYTPPPLY